MTERHENGYEVVSVRTLEMCTVFYGVEGFNEAIEWANEASEDTYRKYPHALNWYRIFEREYGALKSECVYIVRTGPDGLESFHGPIFPEYDAEAEYTRGHA